MNKQSLGEIRFATLARAAEGLTQWRPLLLGFLTLLVTGALVVFSTWLAVKAGIFMYLIGMLAAMVALLAGSSGVGIMLMDKARNETVRSLSAAASAGLLCLPKFLLVGLVIFVATLAYSLLAAVIYFVCKIPFIGGILAFVAHPILVLVAAALLIALIWVIGPLMGPALWSGLSVKAALANVLSIARQRLLEVVLMEVVLYVILGLISIMLFAGLVPATAYLTSLALSITGDINAMAGMFMGGGYYGRGYGGGFSPMGMMSNGSSTGIFAGLGVLYCVIGALLAQVAIMGMNLIYLQARESVNPDDAEDALDSLIGDVRKKAEEAKAQTMAAAERTMAAAERAKQAASQRLQEATAKDASPASEDTSVAPTNSTGSAAVAATAAGLAAASESTQQPSVNSDADADAAQQAQALARQTAEEEAARQRTEAEVARVRAEAEAARQKAQTEAAQAAEEERLRAEAQAAQQTAQKAAEQAAAQKAAEERAAAQAAEAARLKAEADAAQAQRKAEAEAVTPHCPSCKAEVSTSDMFCGECGHKLK